MRGFWHIESIAGLPASEPSEPGVDVLLPFSIAPSLVARLFVEFELGETAELPMGFEDCINMVFFKSLECGGKDLSARFKPRA